MAFGTLKGVFTGNATSISTSAPLNTLASGSAAVVVGDLVYAVFGEQTAPTTTTVTDNLGNTYTATQAATDAGTSTGHAYWSRVTVAGTITAITAVANGGTNNFAGAALIIEGPFAASPLDANPTNTTADVTSPFTCPSSGTLAQAQEVVIGWVVSTGNAVWAATSPNLLGAQIATAAILSVRIGYQTVAATTAVAPAFTGTNPTDDVLGTTSFKQDLTEPFAQQYWPNPPLAAAWPLQEWIHTNFVLGLPAPTLPFNQFSWPPPRIPQYPTSLRGWTSYNFPLYFVAPVATPIIPELFQTPPRSVVLPPPLIAQRSPALLGTPFSQNFWPIPRAFPFSPQPVVFQPSPALLGTLVVAATPFSQQSWPKPVVLPQAFQWAQPYNINLYQYSQLPFSQSLWPAATRTPYIPPRFPQQANIGLLGTLVFGTPFSQQSWPNPVLAPFKSIEWIHTNMALGAPTVTITLPFAQHDWPPPRRPQTPPALNSWTQPYNVGLYQYSQLPFRQSDWPVPRRPLQPIPIFPAQISAPLAATLAAVATPFAQYDWPTPRRLATQLQTYIGQNFSALTTVQVEPFAQSSWPNPQLRAVLPFTSVQQISPALLATLTVTQPFSQQTWPNPQLRAYQPQILPQQPTIFFQEPFAQTNWPTPRRQPTPIQSLLAQSNIVFVGQARPFAQNSWPLPQRPPNPTPIFPQQPSRGLFSTLVFEKPFFQSSWPVPQRPKPLVQYVYERNVQLYRFAQLPFRQLDWPLPRRPRYPMSVFGYIGMATPGLRAFQTGKPFNQNSWPLPRPPLYPYSLYGYRDSISPLPGNFAVEPPPPPLPSLEIVSGYESQVGVWHGGNVRHGRTGKRYRIYR